VRSVKALSILAALMAVSACSTLPSFSRNAAADQDKMAAQARLAELETELAGLKAENEKLSHQLLDVERENETLLAQNQETSEDGEHVVLADMARLNDGPPLSPVLRPQENAIVEQPNAPEIKQSDVPVEAAPRLVQPSFASTEFVFENEADDDTIETASVLFGVHLASYKRKAEAREGWQKLQRENPDELGLLEPRLERVTLPEKGVFLRLIGGGFSSQDKAEALCASLKARGLFCHVSGFTGQRLSLAGAG
jgi:cell division protein FtsB